MRKGVCWIILLCGFMPARGQRLEISQYQEQFQIHIHRSADAVKIDGLLDDPIWKQAEKAHSFHLKFPNDKDKPVRQTEAQLAYDDKFLYVAFTCYDTSYTIVQSLKRDIGHVDNDGVGISLDPMNLHTTGFIFIVNAFNAQSEDQISLVQDQEIQWNWNNKWFSATKRFADRWTAEMAIPFKTLRYPPDLTQWGVNFMRVDIKKNQYSVWTPVPVNFRIYNLGYTGKLVWDTIPPSPGKNRVVIPYLTGSADQDHENGDGRLNGRLNAGLDAKLTLNSSLNLDLTLNPDFSQVEVDQQLTNLTRFDLFFPERRAFFLENADIFGEYGIPGLMQPFYSRRIGLDNDGNRIPILAGARLSGSVTPTTRMGAMSIQTGSKGNFAAQNYAAVSINQNVFTRSVLKAYYLNRQSFMSDEQKRKTPIDAWGRNAGMSFDFVSPSGRWSGWAAYNQSFKPGITKDNLYVETGFNYDAPRFSHVLDVVSMGTNYYTDMGFVQRINNYDALRDTTIRMGFKHIFESASVKWFPVEGPVSRQFLTLDNYIVFNPDNTINERNHTLKYRLDFKNNAGLTANLNASNVNLLYPISFTDATPLPAVNYAYQTADVEYQSDNRKLVSFGVKGGGGSFYNGTRKTFGASLSMRKRPHFNFDLKGEFNRLRFPGSYGSTTLFLLTSRVEINFNTAVSWTTFLQYNTQQKQFNINSRFQYRFRPMSDIYLVYTDNYLIEPLLKNRNRAMVFKLNYWLNL